MRWMAVAGAVVLAAGLLGGLWSSWGSAVAAALSAVVVTEVARRQHISRPAPVALEPPRAPAVALERRETPEAREPRAIEGALELLDEAVLVLDKQRRVERANGAARRLLGGGASLEGRALVEATWSTELAAALDGEGGPPLEVSLPGGRIAVVRVARRDDGGAIVVLRELTDLRRAERARSELVANLSHELRTPIAAARVLAETLEAGVDDVERRARYESRLREEIERLGEMVERAMRLSRIETGAESLDLARIDPARLLHTAAERISPIAEAHGVRVAVEEPSGLPAVVADTERTLEVMAITLHNAVKASARGDTVTLRGALEDGAVRFEVRDEGPGVLPNERERIFERFYTGDRARAPRGAVADDGGGFGLGLAIARHIVARHGGRIWVADEPGPGAVICFTLPIERDDGPSSEPVTH